MTRTSVFRSFLLGKMFLFMTRTSVFRSFLLPHFRYHVNENIIRLVVRRIHQVVTFTHLPVIPGPIGVELHPLPLQVPEQLLLIHGVYGLLMVLSLTKLGTASVCVRVTPHLAPHALRELHLNSKRMICDVRVVLGIGFSWCLALPFELKILFLLLP